MNWPPPSPFFQPPAFYPLGWATPSSLISPLAIITFNCPNISHFIFLLLVVPPRRPPPPNVFVRSAALGICSHGHALIPAMGTSWIFFLCDRVSDSGPTMATSIGVLLASLTITTPPSYCASDSVFVSSNLTIRILVCFACCTRYKMSYFLLNACLTTDRALTIWTYLWFIGAFSSCFHPGMLSSRTRASVDELTHSPSVTLYFSLLTQVMQVSLNVSVAVIGGPNTETMAKSLTASLSLLTSIIGNLGSVQRSQVHLYFDSDISVH
ncbi:hypothetical protein B0H10DRAFT_1963586 [Mycena sp. CBHHK59/15]|nr:hypothetical protein B0H10DRAFT_1963586 [Mycena sp. CBHHK59/15]